ncbi:Nitroreductase [Maridesulfovibrio ferrireducens]|uniref:Nitroreductase n=1 Tax=Maridesulfovibrio ferrireducens TaxID=246191 RepID=A0A1G9J302_9BACT|nr:nitroreductase family protein [Maridesulfovibrio ferrireducens]SDL31656.1 Nitroreductase [Maridesulfovibrio ferrireducens]
MMPVTINIDLCKSDELCVRDCPLGVLKIVEKGQAPIVNPKKAGFCINCGHCVAICPTNAITLNAFADQNATPYPSEKIADPESIETFFKSRRSIRKFKKKPLSVDEIAELIHLAAYAPSGHNTQPVSWTVLDQPEKVQELAALVADCMNELAAQKHPIAKKLFLSGIARAFTHGHDMICRDAPALAVSWAPNEGITPDTDSIISTAHLELAAHSKGFGACWAGYVVMAAKFSEPVRTFLDVPEHHTLHGALLLGHPSIKYKNIPPRHKAAGEKSNAGFVFPARKNEHN